MTMPETLNIAMGYSQDFDHTWYEDGLIICNEEDMKHPNANAQAYIRDDIAKDLARALDMAQVWLNYEGRYDIQGINAALARYNAAVGK